MQPIALLKINFYFYPVGLIEEFMRYFHLLLIGLLSMASGVPAKPPKTIKLARVTVKAGAADRYNTPVFCSLEGITVKAGETLVLEEIKGSKRITVPAQTEAGKPARIWWLLTDTLKAGKDRKYEVSIGPAGSASPPKVQMQRDDQAVRFSVSNKNVLQYNYGMIAPPGGASKAYERSGFIHPVWSPAGEELTTIHPKDHLHHLGIWNPWTLTEFEGRKVDFWNLKDSLGTVRFDKFDALFGGEVYGGFQAWQNHIDLRAPGGEKVALNEIWDVRVYNTGQDGKGPWLWDFTSTLQCASASPMLLKEYRYGGFGFRATQQWGTENSQVLTSEGKTRNDSDGSRGKWCSVSGQTTRGQAGLLFMGHPQNYNFPEPLRVWLPDMYNGKSNVFFNFCPTKNKDWKLEPGQTYVLRYRVLMYDGNIDANTAERTWQDFGNPPQVVVEKVKKT